MSIKHFYKNSSDDVFRFILFFSKKKKVITTLDNVKIQEIKLGLNVGCNKWQWYCKRVWKNISVLCCLARTLTSPIDPFIGFI